VHVPQLRCLDGIVGIKAVRDPMITIVVSTSCYIHFVSYVLTLTAFCAISLHWQRLSSCIMPWVCGGVSLDVGSISCIVGDLAGGIGWSICRSIGCRVARALAAALIAGLTGCITSFSLGSSSATDSRGPWLRRRWRGCSDLLLE
jgi:hypothetical protein